MTELSEDNPLKILSDIFGEVSGYDKDMLCALFLINVSRNIGSFTTCNNPNVSILMPRTNLYALLVAPPDDFHKSTLIRLEDELSRKIREKWNTYGKEEISEKIMEDLKMRHPELSEEVSISFPPLPESKTYDGSPEGIMELLRNIESVHFKATEFGIKLKLQKYQPNRYDTGEIELLNKLYSGESHDRLLVHESKHVDEGKYVTLFGDLHPDELTKESLKLGLLRRCIIVKKGYRDIIVESKAFDPNNNEAFAKLSESYSEQVTEFLTYIVSMGINRDNLTFSKVEMGVKDEVLSHLAELDKQTKGRVKEERVPRYPNENMELILRVTFNVMFLENILKGKPEEYSKEIVLEMKHVKWAEEFLTRITPAYKEEIRKIEDVDEEDKKEAICNYISKKFDAEEIERLTPSRIRNNFSWAKGYDERRKFSELLTQLVEEEKIKVETKKDGKGRPSVFYFPVR